MPLLRPALPLLCLCAAALAGCGGATPGHRAAARPATHTSTSRTTASPAPTTPLAYHPLFNLGAAVADPASAPLPGERFVLLGGLTPADTSTDTVTVAGLHGELGHTALPNAQHDAQAALVGGQVYVFGGGQFSQYDHILRYDPAGNAVSTVGTLPAAASDVAVAGGNGTAYVVGGFDGSSWLSTILAYAPGAPPRVIAHLPVPLRYAAAVFADGYLLVIGGSTPTGISDQILRVDPRSGAVTVLAHLAAGITHAGAGVLGGTVYLVGGRGDSVSAKSDAVLAIDPLTGHQRPAGRLPEPLSDAAVISLGSQLVVAGGDTASGPTAAVGELVP